MITKETIRPDVLGAAASGLCAIHCIATPFLFVMQSCAAQSCCSTSPAWWSAIDYVFIGITYFAIHHSSKQTSKSWLMPILYMAWALLSALVLNEKFSVYQLASEWKYIAAFILIVLHLYNLKYGKAQEEHYSAL